MYVMDPLNMSKESRDTSPVLSELWHDWDDRRLISSGDSMAYEYDIGRPVSALTVDAAQLFGNRHFLQ